MKPNTFEDKVHETVSTVWDVSLFFYALQFITAFLVSVLILYILGLEVYFGFVIAGVFVFWSHMNSKKAYDPLNTIEDGNPQLKDRLSAAYDNRDKDNFIVRELVREVSYDLNEVNTENFLNLKKTNTYITVCIISVFLLLFLMFAEFPGLGLGGLMGGGGSGGGEGTGEGGGAGGGGAGDSGDTATDQEQTVGEGPPEDIYGDSSIATLDGQDLELEMHPEYGEGGEFGADSDNEQINDIRRGITQATAAESYSENIPVEMEDVVRKYFERLAED